LEEKIAVTGELVYHRWALAKLVARYASGGLSVGNSEVGGIAGYVDRQIVFFTENKPSRRPGPVPTSYTLEQARQMLSTISSRIGGSQTVAVNMEKLGVTSELINYLYQEILPRASVTNWDS
jgi:hypothetical protein